MSNTHEGSPSFPPTTATTINRDNRPDRPDFQRREYLAGVPARRLCHALMHGTTGVRALGEEGLPKWPAEKKKYYDIRAKVCQVARYYQRTVQAMVGMICATPPELVADKTTTTQTPALVKGDDAESTTVPAGEVHPLILRDAEDIDGKGTHLQVMARYLAEDAINSGFVAVLIDKPAMPAGIELRYDEEEAIGLRPFWVKVTADQIPSWIVDTPDWAALLKDFAAGVLTADQVKACAKQTIISQVVIHEPVDVPAGGFGTITKDRYRILNVTPAGVTYRVMEHREGSASEGEHFTEIASGQMYAAGGVPFREIPLAVIYGNTKKADFVAAPVAVGLAELNLDHYQVSADRRYMMRICHSPTFAIFDDDPNAEYDEGTGVTTSRPIEIGPNAVYRGTKGGKASWLVADAQALNSSKEEKEEIVRQMAALGMSFLGKDQRGQHETALGRQLDDAAENATHATVARGLQDGMEQAFKFHAMYYRGAKAPSLSINTSYASPTVDPQIAAILWQAVAADRLDMDSFINYITSGDLPDDVAARVDLLRFNAADKKTTEPSETSTNTGDEGDPESLAA